MTQPPAALLLRVDCGNTWCLTRCPEAPISDQPLHSQIPNLQAGKVNMLRWPQIGRSASFGTDCELSLASYQTLVRSLPASSFPPVVTFKDAKDPPPPRLFHSNQPAYTLWAWAGMKLEYIKMSPGCVVMKERGWGVQHCFDWFMAPLPLCTILPLYHLSNPISTWYQHVIYNWIRYLDNAIWSWGLCIHIWC